MKKRIRRLYSKAPLAAKIRYSYIVILVPFVAFLIFCFYHMWAANQNYEKMIHSAIVASEFSLDFKKDFDYETYLLVVENKTIEESEVKNLLSEAKRIVEELEGLSDQEENAGRLESVKKYLSNLDTYIDRITENLKEGNKYEDNIEIWENDVQIVTSLVRESIFQYIHDEIRDIQKSYSEYQDVFMNMIQYSVIVFVALLLGILLLSYYVPRSISRPIREISEVTNQVARGDLTVRSEVESSAEVQVLGESLNAMIDKINELLSQVKTEQVRLRKAEFELLQSQINPHFLYNTLDAIVWLAEAGEQKKVVSMVESLSEFFKTSLNQGKDIVTIKEEMQHVRSYLEIQQMRYQDILHYEIEIPEELYSCLIPKITIQPLVENALYHGIKNKRGCGNIRIIGRLQEDAFTIIVEDDGIGISEERLEQVREGIQNRILTGKNMYGLFNVNERIRLNFGEQYGIFIASSYGERTQVSVILPYMKQEK